MITTIASPTKQVAIGEGPTVIIGERINPSNNRRMAEAMRSGDFSALANEARKQVEAGADIIDVNVGLFGIDELQLLCQAIRSIGVEAPLCLDTSNPAALEAALAICPGKPLVNSVNGEESSLREVLPLVKQYKAAVIALTIDEDGIPRKAEDRVRIAKRILQAAEREGIAPEDIVVDCLATAVSHEGDAATLALKSIRLVKQELGLNTVLGISNVSFGLPDRRALNAAFAVQAIAAGLDAAILDPTLPDVMRAVRSADLLAGRDPSARRYLAHFRGLKKRGLL